MVGNMILSLLGADVQKAWYVDVDPDVEPDILANIYDLTEEILPKFRKIVFMACPIESDKNYIEFAHKFLIPGGEMYITPYKDQQEFEQDARRAGFRHDRTIAISKRNQNYLTEVYVKRQ